jgi:signal transduction histidine kinase
VRYIFHELRTPLNSATLGIRLLVKDPNAIDIEHKETVEDAARSLAEAVEVLDNLMTIDKADKGDLPLHRKDVNAVHFLKACVAPFKVDARTRGIMFCADLHAGQTQHSATQSCTC